MRCNLRVNDKTYGEGITLDQYVVEVAVDDPGQWVTIKIYNSARLATTGRIQLQITLDREAVHQLEKALTGYGPDTFVIDERATR